MNLYLVLALALGAVSGAPAPVARPTAVITEHAVRETRRALMPVGPRAQPKNPVPARRPLPAARLILSGAATPRAPASSR